MPKIDLRQLMSNTSPPSSPSCLYGDDGPDSLETQLSKAITYFGLDVTMALAVKAKPTTTSSTAAAVATDQSELQVEDNFVVSPLALQILLTSILVGTKDQSASRAELAKVLGYGHKTHAPELSFDAAEKEDANSSSCPPGRLHEFMHEFVHKILYRLYSLTLSKKSFSLSNRMLINRDMIDLSEEYWLETKRYYGTSREMFSQEDEPHCVSIGRPWTLRERLNAWVKFTTQDHITELANEASLSDESLRLGAMSVAHLKVHWLHAFDPSLTENRVFYNHGQRSAGVETKFMRQAGVFRFLELMHGLTAHATGEFFSPPYQSRLKVVGRLNCQVLILPLAPDGGQELSLCIIKPTKFGLGHLIESLTARGLFEIYRYSCEHFVEVHLPKFEIDTSLHAEPVLSKMGLSRLFGAEAELDRMVEPGSCAKCQVKVDKVVHRVKIMVDEQGAESAAAPSHTGAGRAENLRKEKFIADEPFLYVVRHNRTNVPLFMGQVTKFPQT